MSTEIVIAAADTLRTLRDKKEVVELLASKLPPGLREKIAEWKDKDLDEIRATLKKKLVDDLKAGLPPDLAFLPDRLAAVDDRKLTLADISREKADAAGAIRLSASLSAAVELDGVLDEDIVDVLRGEIPAGSVLFTASLHGRIGVDAAAKGGTPLVSLAAKLHREREQTLTVGLVRDAEQPAVLELLQLRDYFVNPADLGAVMKWFAEDKTARLVRHEFSGTLAFGMEIGLEKNLDAALAAKFGGTAGAAGKAAASFTVSVKDDDDFVLTVERDTAVSAFVRLERRVRRERTRKLTLGATIRINGLKDQLVNRIAELLPKENGVSAAIGKLDALIEKTDGDDLQAALSAKLAARWPQHGSTFDALLGKTSTDAVAEQVVGELTDTIADRVNEHVNVLSDDATAKAREISQTIAFELGLDPDSAAKVDAFLVEPIESALQDLKSRIDAKIKKTNQSASAELTKILKPFADLSATIQTGLDNVGKTSAASLAKVRAGLEDVYARYTGFRQKLIAVVNERVSEQAALSVVGESTRTETDTALLAFRIVDASAPNVADLYSAVWARRLEDLWALLPASREGLSHIEGSYVAVLERHKRVTVSLDLFGLELSSDVMFSNEVTVGIDPAGKLLVAETHARYAAIKKRRKESQQLTVEWHIDYIDEDPSLAPPIKVNVDVIDASFKPKELAKFFDGLTAAECVKPDTRDAVAAALFAPLNAEKKLKDVELNLVLTLTWEMLLGVLGANRDGTVRADRWNGLDVAAELFAAVAKTRGEALFERLEKGARDAGTSALAMLLDVGDRTERDARMRFPAWAAEHYTLGRVLGSLVTNLDQLQTKWLALMEKLKAKKLTPAAVKQVQKDIDAVDAELCEVLRALFLRVKVKDPSDTWHAAAGARVLLDRTGRNFMLVAVESPLIGRQIFG